MNENVLFFILGIVIPIIIQNIVFPFLPKSIQSFATYQKKRIMKIIKQVEIKIELVIKTEKYNGDKKIDDVISLLKTEFSSQFTVRSENHNLILTVPIGNNNIEVTIMPMHELVDNELRFESLECRFTTKCKFSKFNSAVRDFREAQRKIENILHNTIVPRFKNTLALICKLKSLHEITGILENTNFELMSAELDNGKQFELSKNKITIYDQNINDDVVSLAEKMIVIYG